MTAPNENCRTSEEHGMIVAAACDRAERRSLAAGWGQPVGCSDTALVAGISGQSFTQPAYSFLFAYICTCAEQGVNPRVVTACQLAAEERLHLGTRDLLELLDDEEYRADELDLYAFEVDRLAEARQQFAELSRTLEITAASKHPRQLRKFVSPRMRRQSQLRGRVID